MGKHRNPDQYTCPVKAEFPELEEGAEQQRQRLIAETRLSFEMQRIERQYGAEHARAAENDIRYRLGLPLRLAPMRHRIIDATIPEPARVPRGKRKPRSAAPAEKFFASEAERDRSVDEDLKYLQRVLESDAPEEDRKRAREIILNMRLACYGRREKE